MDYNRAREELKPRLKDYVESITSKSKGANMYVCPICGSGTGHNHTGAFSIDKSNPNRFKCFSCGLSGDLFDLIGAVENITDPLEQLKRAGELYGITIEGRPTAEEDFREVAQNQPKNERYTHMDIHTNTYTHTDTETNLAYYRECQSHLQETDYHLKRGISQQTANRFMLGYDSQYTKSTGGAVWQALIIPTGYYSYVARNTDPQADSKSRYRKTGQATPLNSKALQTATKPIFIVEGEIDALSIIEAGGEAIGLGSTANIDLFINNYLKKQKPAQPARCTRPRPAVPAVRRACRGSCLAGEARAQLGAGCALGAGSQVPATGAIHRQVLPPRIPTAWESVREMRSTLESRARSASAAALPH